MLNQFISNSMFGMWQPKNTIEAILPIRLISWFFSLGIIHYPLNNPRIRLSIFSASVTFFLYIISSWYVLPIVRGSGVLRAQQTIFLAVMYVNIIIHVSDVILMWYWRNRSKKIELRGMQIDETLEKLEAPLNYTSIFIYVLKVAISCCITAVIINIVTMLRYINKIDLFANFVVGFVIQHPIHANTMNAMNFWISIELMRWRFKNINTVLLNIVDEEKNRRDINVNRNWPPALMSISVDDNSLHYILPPQESNNSILRVARHVHLELTFLCEEICSIFGIQIAMSLASSIVTVTCFLFSFYVSQFDANVATTGILYRIIPLIIRLINYCTKVYFMNSCCSEAIIEWRKTGHIIHELHLVSKNKEYRDEVRQFSLQITKNRLTMTAYGLVILGYEFIHDFIGLITTYVIISVQMYGAPAQ